MSRGRLIFTPAVRATHQQLTDAAWLDGQLRDARREGRGEILLIEPPSECAFPPTSSLAPSPHSTLVLAGNRYKPCAKADATDYTKALHRSGTDAEYTTEVQYARWQKDRERQEKSTRRLHHQREAITTDPPPSTRDHTTSVLSSLPQPLHPLFASLPAPLQRLDDPLSIRAFIEAQRCARPVSLSSPPSFSSPSLNQRMATDEVPSARLRSQTKAENHGAAAHEPGVEYVSYDGEHTPTSVAVRKAIELPPMPDPSNAEDEHIRYYKNGSVVMLLQLTAGDPIDSGGADSESPRDPFTPADPLRHLEHTAIHSCHPFNLLSSMNEEYRAQREERVRHATAGGANDKLSQLSSDASVAMDSEASSAVNTEADVSDGDGGGDDVALADSALDTSGSGVLEPTLYCGVRGSMTSMHSENDQLSSFHQVSAGVKVWYSVNSTQENTRKLLRLMRSLQWISGFEERKGDEDAQSDQDYGLKSHLWFFNPRTLLELGLDVHVTVQTPSHSLVLTAGCYHQILNLTAVEGWSCNFLPPCMLELVQSVRVERARGWHWNYPESISLPGMCWKAVTAAGVTSIVVPELMANACARVLHPAITQEQLDRSLVSGEPRSHQASEHESAPPFASRKRRSSRQVSSRPLTTEQPEKCGEIDASSIGDAPLALPLPSREPPRTYPELCTFCQNLSFFSAVYVSTQPSSSAPRTLGVPVAMATRAFHLCCTACLAKYLRLKPKYDSADEAPVKRRKKSIGGATKPKLTFSSAGHLPSDTTKEQEFFQAFQRSLTRHSRWWRVAFLGVRVTDEQLELRLAAAQARLPKEDDRPARVTASVTLKTSADGAPSCAPLSA